MTELDGRIASYAGERRLSRSTVERWRALDERDRGMLWQVAHELRLGENHLRDVLDWLEEIRVRDGLGAAERPDPLRLQDENGRASPIRFPIRSLPD